MKYKETSNILYDIKIDLYKIKHKHNLERAKEGAINSYEILTLITEKDPFYFQKEFNTKENRTLDIFDNVDITKEKSYFFEEFQKNNIWEYFTIFNEEFLLYFLNKIQKIEDFQIIFRLFPKGIIVTCYGKYSLLLADKYKQLLKKREDYEINLLKNDFIELLDILTKTDSKCEEFLHFIENKIDKRIINQIYLDIVNSNIKIDLNEFSCRAIIEFLLKNNKNSNNEQDLPMILFFLEKTICQEVYVKSLISEISDYYLRPNNFFNEENSNNLKIFKILYHKNYFTQILDWFMSSNYYIQTIKSIENIIYSIDNLNIDYITLCFLFDHYNDNLKENIICLCFGRLEKANKLFQKLNNSKLEINEKKNDLNEILSYFNSYFPNSKKNEIKECTKIIYQTNEFKIYQFNNKDYQNFNYILKYKKEAYKFNQLNNSLFFMTIYRETKKQYENDFNIKK